MTNRFEKLKVLQSTTGEVTISAREQRSRNPLYIRVKNMMGELNEAMGWNGILDDESYLQHGHNVGMWLYFGNNGEHLYIGHLDSQTFKDQPNECFRVELLRKQKHPTIPFVSIYDGYSENMSDEALQVSLEAAVTAYYASI